MTDLFGETCPCCGQKVPEAQSQPFDKFWNACPRKVGKAQAQKAWVKLTAAEQSMALERVKAFYAWFQREYPSASMLHPSTYLSNKRWTDVAAEQKIDVQAAKLASAEKAIKQAQGFMASSITAQTARALISEGRVTAEECRAIGVTL